MIPEQVFIGFLIQLSDADTVFVGNRVFRHDIHGNLAQVKVGADPGSSGDAGGFLYILENGLGQGTGVSIIKGKIIADIQKALVDGVDMDVISADVLQVNGIDPAGIFHVESHAGRRYDIGDWISRTFFDIR